MRAVLAESYSDFPNAKKKFKECLDMAPKDDIYYERASRKLARYFKKSEDLVDFFLQLFLQGDVPAAAREKLAAYQKKPVTENVPVYWTEEDAAQHRVRSLCHLVLTLPEFQLD